MLDPILLEVLKHEGVVAIATQGADGPHMVNTWNSYIQLANESLLIPVGGMIKTEKNISTNKRVLLTLGTREVNGKHGRPGTGFLITGDAEILSHGQHFETVKKKFPWARAALKVNVATATQTL
jgi:predicted pyridoxine 5'-phosphate oxidase superfamily flavin-nucleotide-binding protein